MGNKKTNIEYLRDIIEKHVGETNKDEALEFLEAIENDYNDLKDEKVSEETRADEAETALQNIKDDAEYTSVINTGMGSNDNIRWDAPNISAKTMMEELAEAIGRGVPLLKIENVLRAL